MFLELTLTGHVVEFLKNLSPQLITMIVGALPISELRGAIPVGVVTLDLPVGEAFFWAYLGNLLPVGPLLLFLQPVSNWLRRFGLWRAFFYWLFARTRKRARIVNRYKLPGLIVFVALPLPITGAWTGCAAAMIFRIPLPKALFAIAFGVFLSGVIVSTATHTGMLIF